MGLFSRNKNKELEEKAEAEQVKFNKKRKKYQRNPLLLLITDLGKIRMLQKKSLKVLENLRQTEAHVLEKIQDELDNGNVL